MQYMLCLQAPEGRTSPDATAQGQHETAESGRPDGTVRQTEPMTSSMTSRRGKRRPFPPLGGIPLLRKHLQPFNIDKITLNRLVSSTWRPGTVKLYAHYINKWQLFCNIYKIGTLQPSMAQILSFFRTLEDEGLGFGAINTARCALSLVLPRINGQSVGKHYLVHWFLKSVYERNPPKPKYSRFWDVSKVFSLFIKWVDNDVLPIRDLGFKVALLILLITGHRGQTVLALSIDKLELSRKEAVFDLDKLLKSNRTGDPLSSVSLLAFPENKKLCVVRAIRTYVDRTKSRRKHNQLLLSYIKPYGPISRDSLSRWTLRVLDAAGIDTNRFAAHSTRGAVASNARALGVPINTILKNAGWKTSIAFAKHYNKRVERQGDMASTLLRHTT